MEVVIEYKCRIVNKMRINIKKMYRYRRLVRTNFLYVHKTVGLECA